MAFNWFINNYPDVTESQLVSMMAQSGVMIVQVSLMAAIILMSVLGNLLVVASVLCVRSLRQPPNLLLLALAVTDLFVSLVVMPGE